MERANAKAEKSREGALLLAEAVRAELTPFRVATGETVVRQGDAGRRFYFVESGAVDVVATSEEGIRLPLARLGPGGHFGEMSLLTGSPVSAEVVACEPSVLYSATSEEFDRLVRRDRQLLDYLAKELAVRLGQANEQLVVQQQRQATLSKLISSRLSHPFKTLPSLSGRMKAAVAEAGESDLPLLITGERGTGRRALALYVHSESARQSQAILVVDCLELPSDEARNHLFGDADPDFVSRFASRLGYLQAADRGTLVLANVDRLPAEVQEELATFLRTHEDSSEEGGVAVRVIGTIDVPVEMATSQRGLSEALLQAFTSGQVIHLQPLRQRRRDIIPLAEQFLEQMARISGERPKQLGESARRELLSYDFRFENAEELRRVIDLAVDLAEVDVINAEHLFFGPSGEVEAPQVDLLRSPRLEQLAYSRSLWLAVKVAVAVVFGGIVGACLAAPGSSLGRLANLMVWGVWWPVLVISSVLLGRVWCAVCPLSSGAEAIQHAKGLGLSPPDRLRRAGGAVVLVGFAGIIWIEQVAGMTKNPQYTAVLLLSLALIAGAAGWFFQRHTWCRYLCPLGAMSAVFSVASTVRVQARREVCQASCAEHECYRGSEQAKGCPMFNHAMFLNSGQHCKLCLECLRGCVARSPRLVLGLPLRDIWRSNLITTDVVPLAAVLGLLALLLAATPMAGLQSPTDKWRFSVSALAALAVGLYLFRLYRQRERAGTSDGLSWVARVLHAYAPAVAAVLFAFHVRSLPWLSESTLRIGAASGDLLSVSLLQVLQGAAVAVGGIMTLLALWQLCRQRFGPRLVAAVAVWAPLGMLTVAYLVVGLVLLG